MEIEAEQPGSPSLDLTAVVTVSDDGWDHHRGIFPGLNEKLPMIDQAVAALIDDLQQRGRLEETLIILMGEFGRTPTINKDAGRDHWPNAFSVMLAGGGIRGGQVIGRTDAEGGFPEERPVVPEDLFYSLYQRMGIDPEKFVRATNGREIQFVREGRPIRELTS